MLDFKMVTITPAFRNKPIEQEAARLAQQLASLYKNQFKLAIVRHRAIATGKTLQSVKIGKTLDSPSRGVFRRNITARRSWEWIQRGRRAGGKMPVRKNAAGKFEPVPEMREWFKALNIPKKFWFPIMRKIARVGIKPRKIRERMMRESRPQKARLITNAGRKIARELTKDARNNQRTHTATGTR